MIGPNLNKATELCNCQYNATAYAEIFVLWYKAGNSATDIMVYARETLRPTAVRIVTEAETLTSDDSGRVEDHHVLGFIFGSMLPQC